MSERCRALSPHNVDNILFLHKIGLILQISISRSKILLLFAYKTMMILTISVLNCCCLIIDWQHLCKTLFFVHFCLWAGSGRAGLQLHQVITGRAKILQVVNEPGRAGIKYAGPGHAMKFRLVQSPCRALTTTLLLLNRCLLYCLS